MSPVTDLTEVVGFRRVTLVDSSPADPATAVAVAMALPDPRLEH